ncbi:hypothetical protein K3Z88_21085, partial [Pseudomonas aeruginosa]|nr:hypothetical protein [Pseudomonas aeruginosa]
MNSAGEGRIPSPILDEAAEWLVRLQGDAEQRME